MDEGEPSAGSSNAAAGQQLAVGQAALTPEQAPQQVIACIPGARNYGYPDEFMMYSFKVELCNRTDKHPRATCPYAHPGDVARRRHPSRYQALLCPEVRAKKVCPRAEDCQCSHSAFEFWLHPDRYRTSMCEKGVRCSRPVCFFAHTSAELRPLPAGLKPAAPDETSSSSKRISAGSSTDSGWQALGGGVLQWQPACVPVSTSGGVRYVQQQAAQPHQSVVLQPGVQLMPVGPAAGGAAGFAPVGYVPVMQPGLEGGVQYGQMPGHFYPADQQVLMVPAGQQQQFVMQPSVMPGQQQQPAQMSDMVQQFQGMVVSSAPAAAQYEQPGTPGPWPGAGSSSGAGQQPMVMMLPGGATMAQSQPPTAYIQQPQVMYLPAAAEQGSWSQQQYPQGSGSYQGYAGPYPAAPQGAPQRTASGPGSSGGSGILSAASRAGGAVAPAAAGGVLLAPVMQPSRQQMPPVPAALDVKQLGGAAQHGSVLSPPGMIGGDSTFVPQGNMPPLAHGGGMQPPQGPSQCGLERQNW